MKEIQETKTVNIYISNDGKKFNNKSDCEYHERELAKRKLKERIENLTLEELNTEIIKFTNIISKKYTTNIEDALELEKEIDLFYKLDYYLSKDEYYEWNIIEKDCDGYTTHIASGKTIAEVICRTAILVLYKLT